MDSGPVPNWDLDEYRSESTGLMEVRRFEAMASDGVILVMYDCSRLKRYMALGGLGR